MNIIHEFLLNNKLIDRWYRQWLPKRFWPVRLTLSQYEAEKKYLSCCCGCGSWGTCRPHMQMQLRRHFRTLFISLRVSFAFENINHIPGGLSPLHLWCTNVLHTIVVQTISVTIMWGGTTRISWHHIWMNYVLMGSLCFFSNRGFATLLTINKLMICTQSIAWM